MNKTAIIFCVENNILEEQARLLVASIRKFLTGVDVFAFSPRAEFVPGVACEDFFSEHQVVHIKENLNQKYLAYPIANKVLAAAYFEQNYPAYSTVIFVDTDTVFLQDILPFLLGDQPKLYLRPVDNKGPGSEGEGDENDVFWQSAFGLLGVELPNPAMRTTVGQSVIRGYFNAGLIWKNNIENFYVTWLSDFERLVDSGLRPMNYQSRVGDNFRCLDQVALAITAQRYADQLEELPVSFNYPIPFRPRLTPRIKLEELVHVHYHKWFQHPGFLEHVCDASDRTTVAYQWLSNHLPISPPISDGFKC